MAGNVLKVLIVLSVTVVFSHLTCYGVEFKNKHVLSNYLKKLVNEIEKEPKDVRFQRVQLPPMTGVVKEYFFLPKVYFWSPQEQFNVAITCPVHKCPLQPWQWTIDTSGKKGKSPRLIYDFSGNVILFQRIYVCQSQCPHKLFSASTDLFQILPRFIKELFQMYIFPRSGCTKALRQYIVENVMRGVNFKQISGQIADRNKWDFCQRGRIYHFARIAGATQGAPFRDVEFLDDILFSFLSRDHIINVFMHFFNANKRQYIAEMYKINASSISCDHTFKVSKNIGAVISKGEEGKFVKQFKNLYIILNEKGEVVDWRLTKTMSFEEIRDLVQASKNRIEERTGKRLQMVCVDDCCSQRQVPVSI